MKTIKARWFDPAVSLSMILESEKKIGYKFPESYIDIVSKYDALTPIEDTFKFINIYGNRDERDVNFCSYNTQSERANILNEQYISEAEHFGTPNLVTFAICGNGDYICFDYRHNPITDNPKVVLVYHDDFVDYEDGRSHMVINHIADSFEEFMDMLHE